MSNKQKRVMFICSVGGHLTQMLELKPLFNEYKYVLVTEKTDVTVDMKNKYNMEYMVYCSRQYPFSYYFKELYNILKSIYLFFKYRPDVVITTGTHTAVPMMVLAKLFKKKGIFIESFAKRISPTLSGKFIYKNNMYSTFIVQWESMLKVYPKAKYWGTTY